jgi:hypothetical protein
MVAALIHGFLEGFGVVWGVGSGLVTLLVFAALVGR